MFMTNDAAIAAQNKFWDLYPNTLYLGLKTQININPTNGMKSPAHMSHITLSFGREEINSAITAFIKGELSFNNCRVDIAAYGKGKFNEGVLVEFTNKNGEATPSHPVNWMKTNGKVPFITIGVAEGGSAKNTGKLNFIKFQSFEKGWKKDHNVKMIEAQNGTDHFTNITKIIKPDWFPAAIDNCELCAVTANGEFVSIDRYALAQAAKATPAEQEAEKQKQLAKAEKEAEYQLQRLRWEASDALKTQKFLAAKAEYEAAEAVAEIFVVKYFDGWETISDKFKTKEEALEEVKDLEHQYWAENIQLFVVINGKEIKNPEEGDDEFCPYESEIDSYLASNNLI